MRKAGLFLLFFIPFGLLTFLFLSEETELASIAVPGKFSIQVPAAIIPTNTIDSMAILQFFNAEDNISVLVYEENDTSQITLGKRFEQLSKKYLSKIEDGILLKYYPKIINDCPAMIGNIKGNFGNLQIYYRLAIIKVDRQHYDIIIGIPEDNRSGYDRDLYQIVESFRPSL